MRVTAACLWGKPLRQITLLKANFHSTEVSLQQFILNLQP